MKFLYTMMPEHQGFLAFAIHLLSIVQISRSVGLTIDNQLVIIANDCYTRVSIGSKLPDDDVFFTTGVDTISDCEEECSKKRINCSSFSFGIGVKGNGSCALSSKVPNIGGLQANRDYDVYIRSQQTPHCESDQIYQVDNGAPMERKNNTRPLSNFGSGTLQPVMPNVLQSSRANDKRPFLGMNYQYNYPFFDDDRRTLDIVRNKNYKSNDGTVLSHDEFDEAKLSLYAQDLKHASYPDKKPNFSQRIYPEKAPGRTNGYNTFSFQIPAIVENSRFPSKTIVHQSTPAILKQEQNFRNENRQHNAFSKPIQVLGGSFKTDKTPTEHGFWIEHEPGAYRYITSTDHPKQFNSLNPSPTYQAENFGSNYGYKIARPTLLKQQQNDLASYAPNNLSQFLPTNGWNFFDYSINHGLTFTNLPGASASGNGFEDGVFGARIQELKKPCFRKLLSGKKALEVHVRRAVECNGIEECHRSCEHEKLFICEGFNYRRMGPGSRGMCEMTSLPYPRMDMHRDFTPDPQCDYYERDVSCKPNNYGQSSRPSWWPNYPSAPDRPYEHQGQFPLNGKPPGRTDLRPYNNRRPENEPSRPIDYDRHLPNPDPPRPYFEPSNDPFYQKSYPDRRPVDVPYPPRRPDYLFHSVSYPPRPNDYFNGNFHFARPYLPMFSQRRMDYGPQQDIGTNEISSYLPERRKDQNRDWGGYGAVYGGSYGYDTNYVGHGFDSPKQFPKRPPQTKTPRPFESDHFYGQFYNYGGAFGYGDNYIPANEDHLYGGSAGNRECSIRVGAGFRLGRGVVRKTYLTPNVDQCEGLCTEEKSFLCMSFGYRYNVAPTDPTDNCLLSDVSYRDLNFYTDLEPDRDYDIYAIIGESKVCNAKKIPKPHPPDDCFWRVRSGFGMPSEVTRKTMSVGGLGDCQVECSVTQDFTCRSFAFRYGLERGQESSPNCYLSDWPSQEINPVNMPDIDGAELYERGSFGRGCEPNPFPPFNFGQTNNKPPRRDEVCYSGYHRPCRLTPYAVLLSTRVDSESECRQKCSRMRERDSIPCMSFSFKLIVNDARDENCLMSDVPIRDLRPGLDYTYDNDHVLYAWKELDPHCVIAGYSFDSDHVFGGYGHGLGRPYRPGPPRPPSFVPPDFPNRPESYGPDSGRPHGPGTGNNGVRPFDPDRPDPISPTYWPTGSGYDDRYGGNLGANHWFNFFYPNEFSTFRHFTVNGYPCKRGTKCEKNKVAGFWTCEPEGSEFGSWDYCCAPDHHCGYSQGYSYPWCYVGSSADQWRPCSEKYYPYLPSPRPIRPQIGNGHSGGPRDRPDWQDSDYIGRHWPITYLHGEPPPNCTDSLASAATRDHRFDESKSHARADKTSNRFPEQNRMRSRRLRSRNAVNRPDHSIHETNRNKNEDSTFQGRISASSAAIESRQSERLGKVEKIFKPADRRALSRTLPDDRYENFTVAPPTTPRQTNEVTLRNYTKYGRGAFFQNTSFVTSPKRFIRLSRTSELLAHFSETYRNAGGCDCTIWLAGACICSDHLCIDDERRDDERHRLMTNSRRIPYTLAQITRGKTEKLGRPFKVSQRRGSTSEPRWRCFTGRNVPSVTLPKQQKRRYVSNNSVEIEQSNATFPYAANFPRAY